MINLGLTGARTVVFDAGYVPDRAGLGSTTSMRLAEAGVRVACVDYDQTRAEETVEAILAAGGDAFPLVADVTVEEQVDAVLHESVAALGGLDTVVNIVGRANWSRTTETSMQEWNEALAVNLRKRAVIRRVLSGVSRQ